MIDMPTQVERLLTLEQTQFKLGQSLNDLNHHVTMVEGILVRQGLEIREIRNSVRVIDTRLTLFEMNVNNRFETVENRLTSFEQSVNARFETVENRLASFESKLASFEQSVNARFDVVGQRLDNLDNKFDQVLQVLSKVVFKLGIE